MKCPNCAREINDSATFCGYCGTHISSAPAVAPAAPEAPQPPVAPPPVQVPPVQVPPVQAPVVQPTTPLENAATPETPKKKSRVGVILFIVFLCLALILGSVGGFLTARGVVNLKEIFDFKKFSWLDNGYTTEKEDDEEEDDKKDSSDSDDDTDETPDSDTDTETDGEDTAIVE